MPRDLFKDYRIPFTVEKLGIASNANRWLGCYGLWKLRPSRNLNYRTQAERYYCGFGFHKLDHGRYGIYFAGVITMYPLMGVLHMSIPSNAE